MSTRYKIRQKMFSIGDDFWIENQDGKRVFKVDGKALRLRNEPELREATQAWFEARAERPDDVPAADWMRWEQEKHQRLLAEAAR